MTKTQKKGNLEGLLLLKHLKLDSNENTVNRRAERSEKAKGKITEAKRISYLKRDLAEFGQPSPPSRQQNPSPEQNQQTKKIKLTTQRSTENLFEECRSKELETTPIGSGAQEEGMMVVENEKPEKKPKLLF